MCDFTCCALVFYPRLQLANIAHGGLGISNIGENSGFSRKRHFDERARIYSFESKYTSLLMAIFHF